MKAKKTTLWICKTAIMTALTAVATLYISVPTASGGHTNLGDAFIFLAALMFDPALAAIAGGIGTMLADIIAYPTTAVFSLVFHGLEGLVCGLLIKKVFVKNEKYAIITEILSMLISGTIVIAGFFLAKTYFYGTLATALVSLPKNAAQIALSAAIAIILYRACGLKRIMQKNKY